MNDHKYISNLLISLSFLLRFLQTKELLSWKAIFTIAFFSADNQKTQKHTKRIEIHQSNTNHDLLNQSVYCKALFPERSAKMIDGSEKHKLQLAFELLSLHVFEKRNNYLELKQYIRLYTPLILSKTNPVCRQNGQSLYPFSDQNGTKSVLVSKAY